MVVTQNETNTYAISDAELVDLVNSLIIANPGAHIAPGTITGVTRSATTGVVTVTANVSGTFNTP